MQAGTVNVLQNTDLLGIVIQRPGPYYSNANYVDLMKLAGVDASWRRFIASEISKSLQADADQFMLDTAILYQRGDLKTLVQGLLHFRKFKHEILQLYATTALHVACTTGHYLTQSRKKKDVIVAGGVEAMLSAMITNPSCMSLHIVCLRMIKIFVSYKKIDLVNWGWWTERQANAAIECIIDSMQRFSSSLDLQCVAIACLAALCVPGDATGDDQTYICKRDFRRRGGLPLLVTAMQTHSDTTMYIHICQIFFLFSNEVLGWQQFAGSHNELVVLQALRHSVTVAHIESIRDLTKLLCQLCLESVFLSNIIRTPLAISLCEQSLQLMQGHLETDTVMETSLKQSSNVHITTLLFRLTQRRISVHELVLIPGSVNLILQTLSESHNLSLLQPPELFQGTNYITMQMCSTIQLNICQILCEVTYLDHLPQIVIGVLSSIFIIVGETMNTQVRQCAFHSVYNIACEDNNQRLLILRAGGLSIMASLIRLRRNDDRIVRSVVALLDRLLEFPVYATAMFELGFVDIFHLLIPLPRIDAIIARLQLAATNPVYPP